MDTECINTLLEASKSGEVWYILSRRYGEGGGGMDRYNQGDEGAGGGMEED